MKNYQIVMPNGGGKMNISANSAKLLPRTGQVVFKNADGAVLAIAPKEAFITLSI